MKSKLLITTIFMLTAATVIGYPLMNDKTAVNTMPIDNTSTVISQNDSNKIEVVFVLDTTGSMSGLIDAAKEKIWSIASTMASAQSAPEIRMGLVAYRDRGDEYITRVIDLSEDLDTMYATLMDFEAAGGGDGPESVNQALHDAIHNVSWSQDQDTYKVVFMVGDAPPHMDYQDDVKYPVTTKLAQGKGIVINTIQCGEDRNTTHQWTQIAQLGGGDYFQVEQAGNAVAITTPFDKKLAELSREVEDTRMYFGDETVKAMKRLKQAATDKLHSLSSDAALARRAEFNSSASGKANMYGKNELVGAIMDGSVDLEDLEKDKLPNEMQAMTLSEQKRLIEEKAEKRQELERQIEIANKQRSDYLKDKAKEAGGYKDSLDDKIYSAVREQAAKKGFIYEAETPTY